MYFKCLVELISTLEIKKIKNKNPKKKKKQNKKNKNETKEDFKIYKKVTIHGFEINGDAG